MLKPGNRARKPSGDGAVGSLGDLLAAAEQRQSQYDFAAWRDEAEPSSARELQLLGSQQNQLKPTAFSQELSQQSVGSDTSLMNLFSEMDRKGQPPRNVERDLEVYFSGGARQRESAYEVGSAAAAKVAGGSYTDGAAEESQHNAHSQQSAHGSSWPHGAQRAGLESQQSLASLSFEAAFAGEPEDDLADADGGDGEFIALLLFSFH